jgi:hypothetical protein
MRHLIGSERPIQDPSGTVMPVRGKMNFIGARVSASESSGTTTVNVESVGSTDHIIQRFINNAGSLAQTDTDINVGSVDGAWASFMDEGVSDLPNGLMAVSEAGLYHFRFEMYLTSGGTWTAQTSWPRLKLDINNSVVGLGQDFTFRYHYPASSPYAYANVSATEYLEATESFSFFVSMPASWTTRSFTSKVLINRVA